MDWLHDLGLETDAGVYETQTRQYEEDSECLALPKDSDVAILAVM